MCGCAVCAATGTSTLAGQVYDGNDKVMREVT